MSVALLEAPANVIVSDACIIEEQKEHLVVALRIPKSTILNNHALLCALSECATRTSHEPAVFRFPRAPHPPVRQPWLMPLAFGALALLAGVAAYPTIATAIMKPPSELRSMTVDTPQIRAGEDLILNATLRRNRVCRAEYDRTISTESGHPVHSYRDYYSVTGVTNGFQSFKVKVTLPDNLPPGKYYYRGYAVNDCNGVDFHHQHPQLPFEVIE